MLGGRFLASRGRSSPEVAGGPEPRNHAKPYVWGLRTWPISGMFVGLRLDATLWDDKAIGLNLQDPWLTKPAPLTGKQAYETTERRLLGFAGCNVGGHNAIGQTSVDECRPHILTID